MKRSKPLAIEADRLLDLFVEAGVTPDEVRFDDDGRMVITIGAMKKLAVVAKDPAEAFRQIAEMEAMSGDLKRMDDLSNCRASGQVH